MGVGQRGYDVTGLLPWRHYDVRVIAYNLKGRGIPSDVITVRTDPEGEGHILDICFNSRDRSLTMGKGGLQNVRNFWRPPCEKDKTSRPPPFF